MVVVLLLPTPVATNIEGAVCHAIGGAANTEAGSGGEDADADADTAAYEVAEGPRARSGDVGGEGEPVGDRSVLDGELDERARAAASGDDTMGEGDDGAEPEWRLPREPRWDGGVGEGGGAGEEDGVGEDDDEAGCDDHADADADGMAAGADAATAAVGDASGAAAGSSAGGGGGGDGVPLAEVDGRGEAMGEAASGGWSGEENDASRVGGE